MLRVLHLGERPRTPPKDALIHESVFQRMEAKPDYRPSNVDKGVTPHI